MLKDLEKISQEWEKQVKESLSLDNLTKIQQKLFHKKTGTFTDLTQKLGQMTLEEKKEFGQALNTAKTHLNQLIQEKTIELSNNGTIESSWFDVTLPTSFVLKNEIKQEIGSLHPITETIREITQIFSHLGFIRRRYPEIETDYYAFESLNMPEDHPARAEWETFYVEGGFVVTPHTSSGQVREMERGEIPIRMINISRCGRRQEDLTHIPTFYQFEGLLIDKNISIANLKGVLTYFAQNYFGAERAIRLRPYNFRFTEPSFEIDVSCGVCGGKGCKTCKEGWLEMGGAGMVHPNVLRAGKLDPKEVTGFAFGWGVERVYMMKNPENALPDIRLLYTNDLRFLNPEVSS